jgi:undecaprenyl-diphosphatase
MRRMRLFQRVLGHLRGGYAWIRTLELAVLVAGLAFAASLLVFLRVAHEVGEERGGATGFDRWALESLRDPADRSLPLGPPWLRALGRDLTALGSSGVLSIAVAATALGLALAKRWRQLLFVLGACVSGVVLSLALKFLFARARPDSALHAVDVITHSFPSGHSMNAAIVYLTLGTFLARVVKQRALQVYVFTASVAVTFLVGLSRVYLGVHYPTDVLAGWCAGFVWALAWWGIAEWVSRRRPRLLPEDASEPVA